MFTTRYAAESFPKCVVHAGKINFSAGELAHALFVTGKAPGDVLKHGRASLWEFLHRAALVPAYLRYGPDDRLTRSRLALELDRSEKMNLSYSIGQAVTGVFCERLLRVTHLMHVDRYASRYNIDFGTTKQRPDLFGHSSKGWVLAEAKGRSNAMESVLKKKLRSQKRAVKTIAGQPPSIALGCVASFPPQETGLRIDAFDPSENERKAIDLEIDVDRFVLAYYEPFLTAIENASEIELNDTFVTGTFPSLGLRIGLHNRVVEQVSSASQHGYAGLADRVFRALSNVAADEQHQFADGSRFLTEWDAALEIQDYEI